MPDALEQLINELDDEARSSIRNNWAVLNSTERQRFWQELTGSRKPEVCRQQALFIAETLLGWRRPGSIRGPRIRPTERRASILR